MNATSFYQPVPFKEYADIETSRKDCAERWDAIKSHMGSLEGKTLIDIGCSNGYFMFQFMLNGGARAVGIEPNHEEANFVRGLAYEKDLCMACYHDIEPVGGQFDYGLYLDLHYHAKNDYETINYLPWLKERVGVLFVSASGDGTINSKRLKEELDKSYSSVIKISDGYVNRAIFKCGGVK